MAQLGLGLIGCGGMGRALGQQLVTVESARLIAVTDVNADAASAAAQELGSGTHPDVTSLLADPQIGAVVIATPGFLHRPVVEQAAAAGKHVFVEKPMAVTADDCDAILAAAAGAGITLMVGQVLRYYPCWWKCLELVRAGTIGEVWGISVTRAGGGWTRWSQPWRQSLAMCGGLLMEVNAHEIDFMVQAAGEVERVYAEADHFGDDGCDYSNLLFVSLRFRSGAVGMLHSSNVSGIGDLNGKIEGSEGSLLYTGGFGGDGSDIHWARKGGERERLPIRDIRIENPVRKELRLFVEAVQNGTAPPVTGAEARHNVLVALAAYESARTGGPVHL